MSFRSSTFYRHAALSVTTTALGLALIASTRPLLNQLSHEAGATPSEALYLPDERAVELVSFGYRKPLATFLWFRTINYFGKHYVGDQQYQWLYHMCDLVTTLDPGARHAYEFGSNMLAWEAGAPQQGYELLTKGMEKNPDWWKFPYLRGFISLYFLNDPEGAKKDFVLASHLPDVHPIVVGLAAKTVARQDDPEQGIEFLKNVLSQNDDPSVRKVLIDRLRELSYERDQLTLEKALTRFRQSHNEMPTSIEELTPFLEAPVSLSDPFGGNYYIDSSSGTVKSSSNHKRFGKKR